MYITVPERRVFFLEVSERVDSCGLCEGGYLGQGGLKPVKTEHKRKRQ